MFEVIFTQKMNIKFQFDTFVSSFSDKFHIIVQELHTIAKIPMLLITLEFWIKQEEISFSF